MYIPPILLFLQKNSTYSTSTRNIRPLKSRQIPSKLHHTTTSPRYHLFSNPATQSIDTYIEEQTVSNCSFEIRPATSLVRNRSQPIITLPSPPEVLDLLLQNGYRGWMEKERAKKRDMCETKVTGRMVGVRKDRRRDVADVDGGKLAEARRKMRSEVTRHLAAPKVTWEPLYPPPFLFLPPPPASSPAARPPVATIHPPADPSAEPWIRWSNRDELTRPLRPLSSSSSSSSLLRERRSFGRRGRTQLCPTGWRLTARFSVIFFLLLLSSLLLSSLRSFAWNVIKKLGEFWWNFDGGWMV